MAQTYGTAVNIRLFCLLSYTPKVPPERIELPFTGCNEDCKAVVIAVILRQQKFNRAYEEIAVRDSAIFDPRERPKPLGIRPLRRWFRYITPNRLSLRHTSQIATLGFIEVRTSKGLSSCGDGSCTRNHLLMRQGIFC